MRDSSPHRFWRLTTMLALVATVVTACGDDSPDPTGTGGSPPLPDQRGAGAYAEHCASCHGADLRGTDQGPSHLSQVYEPGHHPDWSFEVAIREGVRAHHFDYGDMPPVEGISDTEVADIIAYVRAVQDAEGFEPYPP